MAYQKKTLADLKQSLSDRHDSGVLPTSSQILSFWVRLLNRGQAYCTDRLKLTKPLSITTVSGTVSLPDDYINISEVYNGDQEYYPIGLEEKEKQGEPYVYWIGGNHFDGFTLNTASDETLDITYSFRPSEMASDSDVCIIPDPEAVVAYAYGMLRKSETDPIGDADAALAECDSRLNEVTDVQMINDNFQGLEIYG